MMRVFESCKQSKQDTSNFAGRIGSHGISRFFPRVVNERSFPCLEIVQAMAWTAQVPSILVLEEHKKHQPVPPKRCFSVFVCFSKTSKNHLVSVLLSVCLVYKSLFCPSGLKRGEKFRKSRQRGSKAQGLLSQVKQLDKGFLGKPSTV